MLPAYYAFRFLLLSLEFWGAFLYIGGYPAGAAFYYFLWSSFQKGSSLPSFFSRASA
jgi:hypothetical protein